MWLNRLMPAVSGVMECRTLTEQLSPLNEPNLATQLTDWMAEVRPLAQLGHLPQYVPELAQIDPAFFAVGVRTAASSLNLGQAAQPFTLMSMMKPFLLLYALEIHGPEVVFERVGTLPSDQPFYSLKQLAADRGQPRNPMINSGALSLVELLPGRSGAARAQVLQQWLAQQAQIDLPLDEVMLASVRSLPNDANRAIAQMLKNAGAVQDPAQTLDTYNHICCLAVTVASLARLGLLLALPQAQIARQSQRIVNAIMLTCGVYEVSGDWAVRIGLPVKSGVSGGILAVVPQVGAIGIYSPTIDDAGNSVAGSQLLEKMVHTLDLSCF